MMLSLPFSLENPVKTNTTRIVAMLFFIYVLILPISHTTALRNLVFFSLAIITFWLAWRGKIRLSIPIVKPWLLYLAVAVLSLLYAIEPWYSLHEIKTEIGYGFLAMVLGATWINTPKNLLGLVWAIISSNALLVLGSFYYATPLLAQVETIVVGGFQIGVGKLSTYIILMLPLIVATWSQLSKQHFAAKIFLEILIIGNIAALYFTGNRAGPGSLLAEITVWLVIAITFRSSVRLGWRKWLILAIAIISIGALEFKQIIKRASIPTNVSASITQDGRWDIWSLSLLSVKTQPLSGGGFGLDAFKLRNPEFAKDNPQMWHAHNTVLNVGVQTGIPGMVAFLILISSAFIQVASPLIKIREWNAIRIYSAAAVVMFSGLAVKLQTDDFFTRDIALFYWLLVGALISTFKHKQPA